jgi:hypothetical protein
VGLKNDRKTVLALWLLVLGSLLVVVTKGGNRIPSRQDSDEGPNDDSPQIPMVTSTPTLSREPYEPAATPWWRGLPEAACLVVAFGLLIVTVWQSRAASHSVQKMVDATQETTEKLARQLELSQRPWVSVNAVIVGPLTFNADGAAEVTLQFAIRNVGNTPAKSLSVEPKMFIASFGEQDPVMERSRVCEENRIRGVGTDGTLFPTIELTRSVTFHVDAKEIIKESNRTGSFTPALVVCASYRSTFDDRSRYTTGVIYYLRRIDPAHPGVYIRMTNGIEIPRDLLALRYDPIGETIAD